MSRATSRTPVMDSVVERATPVTAPPSAPVSLVHVLRSLNSMSSDGVRQLHERLSIITMIESANQYRDEDPARFDVVKRLLVAAGVQGI